MEKLDVLGFYFKKFDILSSKIIAALVNLDSCIIKNKIYIKNAEENILKLENFLTKLKIFNVQEIQALLVIFKN